MANIKAKVTAATWHRPQLATLAGYFLIAYFVFLLVFRYNIRGLAGAYDVFWACNVALLVAAYGMLTKNASVLAAAVGMISMAHALWYSRSLQVLNLWITSLTSVSGQVDVIAYLTMGIWPVGLAKYITWPTTTQLEIYTTLHHIWFIPLCFAALYKNGRMDIVAWRYSMYFALVLIILTYICTPLSHDGIYLNVNCAHEFWKDVEVPFLHSFNPPKAPWVLYVVFVYTLTMAVNSLLFVFWRQVHFVFWPEPKINVD